jgi:RNA polymerase sigma-70 factor (ECF subfamily)
MPDTPNDRFARLFSDTRAALRRYVRRKVKSREATEDIVQEAYLHTFQYGAKAHTPRAMLFTIARNLAANARRRQQVREPGEDRQPVEEVDAASSPEDIVLSEQRIQLLRDTVERLPPKCRAVFSLKVFYDLTHDEIAQRLGISRKTVENHMVFAMRHAHERLKRHREPT